MLSSHVRLQKQLRWENEFVNWPNKHLYVNAVVSCENHAIFFPWNSQQQHFWHCSKLKTAVAYQWLESRRNANQSNVDSKLERLCVGCSKQ